MTDVHWQMASTLLSVEQRRASLESTGSQLYPAFAGVANLFFCAYMDRYLRNDPHGHYLSLFLFVEFSAIALISVATFIRSMSEVVQKSSVFPATPWSYLFFVMRGFIRRPLILSLVLSMQLFLLIPLFSKTASALLCLFVVAAAFFNIEMIVAVLCLKLTRSGQPVAGFAMLTVYGTAGMLFAAIVFHMDTLLDATPIISWTTSGILAAQRGIFSSAAVPLLALVLTFILITFLGKKLA